MNDVFSVVYKVLLVINLESNIIFIITVVGFCSPKSKDDQFREKHNCITERNIYNYDNS